MSYVLDSYTKLYIPFNGEDGDTTPQTALTGQTVTLYGGAQIDTEYQKCGTSSLLCGSGDYATVLASADWSFGTGDFYVDMWIRPTSNDDQIYCGQYYNSNTYWYIGVVISGLQILVYNNNDIVAHYRTNTLPTTGEWNHILVSRHESNVYIFLHGNNTEAGELYAIGTKSMPDTSSKVLQISGMTTGGTKYLGSLAHFRISKGNSIINNFTPPDEASFLVLF